MTECVRLTRYGHKKNSNLSPMRLAGKAQQGWQYCPWESKCERVRGVCKGEHLQLPPPACLQPERAQYRDGLGKLANPSPWGVHKKHT